MPAIIAWIKSKKVAVAIQVALLILFGGGMMLNSCKGKKPPPTSGSTAASTASPKTGSAPPDPSSFTLPRSIAAMNEEQLRQMRSTVGDPEFWKAVDPELRLQERIQNAEAELKKLREQDELNKLNLQKLQEENKRLQEQLAKPPTTTPIPQTKKGHTDEA
jgi:hypothetical protein